MEIILFAEKIFFILLFTGLLIVTGALVMRVNNSVKMTKLRLPFAIRLGILLEVIFLAVCIFVVLLTGHL